MTDIATATWSADDAKRLGTQFKRGGWIGFFIQLLLLIVPILIAIFLVVPSGSGSGAQSIDLSNYLSYGGLLVMLFTTFWFYRYTRIGHRLQDPSRIPSQRSVDNTLWIGIWASILGIGFSVLLLLGAGSRLLSVLLATPQTGLMVAPAIGGDPSQSISALDVIAMNQLLLTLTAEIFVMGISLWLLYRSARVATMGTGS